MMFSQSETILLCGGCGRELEENAPGLYICELCGVEIDDSKKSKVKI